MEMKIIIFNKKRNLFMETIIMIESQSERIQLLNKEPIYIN